MAKSRLSVALSIAGTLATAAVPAIPAQAAQPSIDRSLATPDGAELILAQSRGCFRGERSADCRQRLRVERQSNRHYVYRNGHYEDNSGAAVAGTILGFVLGAAVAGKQEDRDYYNQHRHDRDWQVRCRSSYHDFDGRSGTYRGDDGYRHYCTR